MENRKRKEKGVSNGVMSLILNYQKFSPEDQKVWILYFSQACPEAVKRIHEKLAQNN